MVERVSDWPIVIRDSATDAETAELRDAVHEFNFEATGYRDGRALSCFLRGDDGALVAGIGGFTGGGYARGGYLWGGGGLGRHGFGSQTPAGADAEKPRGGCHTVEVRTQRVPAT